MKRWRYRTVSDWNISFIKQYWRYFHSGEVSVNHQSWTAGIPLKRRTAGTLLPIIMIYLVMWLRKILISQILMDSDVQMSRYFSKSHCPIVVMLQAPGEECHLDYSQELYLSIFGNYRSSRSEFLIYKFKLLSFLKRLYNMSSTTCIHDPLPITPWRHSLTQTWPIKHWEYLGMKL